MAEHYASSVDAVAAFAGLDRRRINTFKKRPGFPPKEKDGYPLGAIVRWLRENVWTTAPADTTEADNRRARNAELDVELKELELEDRKVDLAAKRKRLVDRQVQKLENMKLFAYIRSRLGKQASEHAMIFPDDIRSEAVQEWNEANRLLCRELSQYRPEAGE